VLIDTVDNSQKLTTRESRLLDGRRKLRARLRLEM
jgi:hypothetical protein